MFARRRYCASAAQLSLEKIKLEQSIPQSAAGDKTRPSYSYEKTATREDAVIEDVLSCVAQSPKRPTTSDGAWGRAERIRRFLEYIICIDYQINPRLSLQQAEREYFARINNRILECHEILLDPTPDEKEKSRLISFIWDHVHEPCGRAELRAEYAMTAITRFFRYQSSGKYNGCIWETLRDEGIGRLAEKLSTDMYELVPTIFRSCPGHLTRSVLSQVTKCRDDFFLAINRPEEVPPCLKDWSHHKEVWYMPNRHGKDMSAVEGKVENGGCTIM